MQCRSWLIMHPQETQANNNNIIINTHYTGGENLLGAQFSAQNIGLLWLPLLGMRRISSCIPFSEPTSAELSSKRKKGA